MLVTSGVSTMDAGIAEKFVKAGSTIRVEGNIDPGQDLFIVSHRKR